MYDIVIAAGKSVADKVNRSLKGRDFNLRVAGAMDELNSELDGRIATVLFIEDSFLDKIINDSFFTSIVSNNSNMQIIVHLADETSRKIEDYLRFGINDFVNDTYSEPRILHTIKRCIEFSNHVKERGSFQHIANIDGTLLGNSRSMRDLKNFILQASRGKSRTIIVGGYGTEKLAVAKSIHSYSKRDKSMFVTFNAGSYHSIEEMEIALFGTTAPIRGENGEMSATRVVGLLELAHGGTFVLEELMEVPLKIQKAIDAFVKTDTIYRKDDNKAIQLDVHFLSTSSKPLDSVENNPLLNSFIDLLGVSRIEIPDLATRREDIPLICQHFWKKACDAHGVAKIKLNEGAIVALQSYNWQGNDRHLRTVIEWLASSAVAGSITEITAPMLTTMLPTDVILSNRVIANPALNADMMNKNLKNAREVFEKQYLEAQLERFGGNISHTAGFIGMERTALHRKLVTLEIDGDRIRSVIKGYTRKKRSRRQLSEAA